MIKIKYRIPTDHIVLRNLTMPKNTNANGNIFGGWIISQIDIGGAILAKEISGGKVTTVCMKNVTFIEPILSGDLLDCYGRCIKIGNTSITINIQIWIKKLCSKPFGKYYCATKAQVVYVAIDRYGNKRNLLPMSII